MLESVSLLSIADAHWSFGFSWDMFHQLDLSSLDVTFFAQFQQDVMADIRRGLQNFVQSGQLVAVIIGLVLGYLFRSITVA